MLIIVVAGVVITSNDQRFFDILSLFILHSPIVNCIFILATVEWMHHLFRLINLRDKF